MSSTQIGASLQGRRRKTVQGSTPGPMLDLDENTFVGIPSDAREAISAPRRELERTVGTEISLAEAFRRDGWIPLVHLLEEYRNFPME